MKNTPSRIIISSIAALAFGLAPAAQSQNAAQSHRVAAIRNGQTTRQIERDHFGGYASGILSELMRNRGNSPRDWGMSQACRRMVRKNRMHRLGVGHAKI